MPTTLAQNFEHYLLNSEVSSVTLRNYRADLGNFLTWTQTFLARRGVTVLNDSSLISQFSPFLIKEFVLSQTVENTPPATINRRLSSLRSFGKFLVGTGYLKDNPFSSFQNLPNPKRSQGSQKTQIISKPHYQPIRLTDTPTLRSTEYSDSPEKKISPKFIALTGIAAVLLIVSLTQSYFLVKKSPTKTKTVVLGAFTLKQVRFPLPAPSVTFGDLLKKENYRTN